MEYEMNKNTPGPWRIIEPQEDKLRPYGVQMGKEGGFLVPCYTAEQSKHNANLIAAAPDMLEALEHLLTRLDDVGDERIAQEAIAKARGETE